MQILATVHSAVTAKRPVTLELADGQTVTADISVLTVELVSDDPGQSNFTIHAPADESHVEMFSLGARIAITITPLEAVRENDQ